jgi:hypothetical protein
MFIFEVTVVLYFIKILSGSRNFYRLRMTSLTYVNECFHDFVLFVAYSRTIRTIRRLFADYSYYSSTIRGLFALFVDYSRTIRTIRRLFSLFALFASLF